MSIGELLYVYLPDASRKRHTGNCREGLYRSRTVNNSHAGSTCWDRNRCKHNRTNLRTNQSRYHLSSAFNLSREPFLGTFGKADGVLRMRVGLSKCGNPSTTALPGMECPRAVSSGNRVFSLYSVGGCQSLWKRSCKALEETCVPAYSRHQVVVTAEMLAQYVNSPL